jgi:hypothetical protein
MKGSFWNMSGGAATVVLVMGITLVVAIAALAVVVMQQLMSIALVLGLVWGLSKYANNKLAEREEQRQKPQIQPERVMVGNLYVCTVHYPDGNTRQLSARSVGELDRMVQKSLGPGHKVYELENGQISN